MAYYRRHLPHWQPEKATFFVTFRLAGSLPQKLVRQLRQSGNSTSGHASQLKLPLQRYNKVIQIDGVADGSFWGPRWLGDSEVASIVKEAIHFRNGRVYHLFCYCIMPNHVHMIFKCFEKAVGAKYPVTAIMRSLKGYTAHEANKLLNRRGAFWLSESYDHVIRNVKEMRNMVIYTLENPVKAGLVKSWNEWPHSYCAPEVEEFVL